MGTLVRSAGVLIGMVACTAAAAVETESMGNTDGVLVWQIGTLPPGQTAREVVLFAFDDSHEKVLKRLSAARRQFAESPEPVSASPADPAPEVVWIKNDATDFALAGPGHFFWEGLRQGLTGPHGGQLSRFGYYVHYHDGARRRAGTPINNRTLENLRVVAPVRPAGPREAIGETETADGKLKIGIRAMLGDGPVAAVEIRLTNQSDAPLSSVRLSAYANLESAHTHEDDYSVLESRTGGVLVVDPYSGVCLVMAGLNRPISGHSGIWASQGELQEGAGVDVEKWPAFTAIPEELKKRMAARAILAVPHAPAGPVEPAEPETRDLAAEEAQAVLQRDWLFQADDNPTRKRTADEVQWARALAARLHKTGGPDLSAQLAELDVLEERLEALEEGAGAEAVRKVYLDVRRVKRRIMLKNPVVDFTQVLFIDQPYPRGAEWPHQARHRNGMMATPGGRLLVLEGLHPGSRVRKLAAEKPGAFWRPDLSFDARRVLFCYMAHDESSFHLYEIGIDGTGLRQLTDGPYDDVDPIYLPDGHIIFTTTRGNTYVRCMPYTYCYVLARCDADGENVYLISRNTEPDWCPVVLNDGQVELRYPPEW
ncbi:MAG: TolB family protein, partial [Planctomycetota bacterium]